MRLDEYLSENKVYQSRNKAKEAILRGEVAVDGKIITKSSFNVGSNNVIAKNDAVEFVSLGGYKLLKALKEFNFSVKDTVSADIGASTGGFTDCLIQNGAKKVFAVDLNDTLLHLSLKNNPKVFPVIKNAKELKREDFNEKLDLLCADLSFISLTSVLPVFYNLVDEGVPVILLIKPQFEVGKRIKLKNGIIRDQDLREDICKKVLNYAVEIGFSPLNICSTQYSSDKNMEFLILLKKEKVSHFDFDAFLKNNL